MTEMKTILLGLLAAAWLVTAQDNRPPDANNHFIYPPLPGPQFSNDPSIFSSNLAFTVGSPQSQPFKWLSNMSSMMIYLQQEGNQLSVQQHALTGCQSGVIDSLYWDGNIGNIDLKNGTQAYLSVYNCSNPGSTPVFFSHYINLTEPVVSSSTVTGAAATTNSALPTTTTTTSAVAVPSLTGTNEASSTSSPSSSLNTSAIGGGIGGGIGGAIVLVAVGFAILRIRKRHGNIEQAQNQAAPASSQIYHEHSKPSHPASWQNTSYTPQWHASELESLQDSERVHRAGYETVISELPAETAWER
ncbi:hypothetical protein F4678DRAFT_461045 [Xylaria arbuscula]|nr:hypothetical protein F4678DRAFT_461045 [Xylaria arbuscula]